MGPHFLKVAVITHPTLFGKLGGLRIDVGHILLTVALTFAGAALGYLEAEPTTTLVAALSTWATAKPILLGAVGVGLAAVVAMAKNTFLTPPPSTTNAVPPVPPALTVVAFGLLFLLPGCQTIAAVYPKLDAVEAAIAKDYEAGDSDAQIASDACAALGGNATTDAICANVAQIVADASAFLVSMHVLSTVAESRASAAQPRFLALAKASAAKPAP